MNQITITEEMQRAVELISSTTQHVFVTGKAGTGKTTLLKHITENLDRRFIVSAPTGIAAINAGGTTLHSLFRIPFGPTPPTVKIPGGLTPPVINMLRKLEVLIIDEISMVRADTLDFIDKRLRQVRGSGIPFGGVQLVMFGDLYQLPPVVKKEEATMLEAFYSSPYFFNALAFNNKGFNVVELSHIFRQSDPRFIEILNNIRSYNVTDEDIEDLCTLRDKALSGKYDDNAIHICTHRKDVDSINSMLLNEPTHSYNAVIEGAFNINNAPCEQNLLLRVGARVMTLVNNHEAGYCNGSLGIVSALEVDKITIRLDEGNDVTLTPYKWEDCEYELKGDKIEKKVKGSCTQFPVTLAWAITIHKSQGLTFDNIVIHTKGVFCSGQMYVALSRCRSMEGIVTDTFINRRHILPDQDLIKFNAAYRQTNNYFSDKSKTLMMQ